MKLFHCAQIEPNKIRRFSVTALTHDKALDKALTRAPWHQLIGPYLHPSLVETEIKERRL